MATDTSSGNRNLLRIKRYEFSLIFLTEYFVNIDLEPQAVAEAQALQMSEDIIDNAFTDFIKYFVNIDIQLLITYVNASALPFMSAGAKDAMVLQLEQEV